MQPRMRGPMEQLLPISENNLVINNVNHLKEFILNYGFHHLNFQLLA